MLEILHAHQPEGTSAHNSAGLVMHFKPCQLTFYIEHQQNRKMCDVLSTSHLQTWDVLNTDNMNICATGFTPSRAGSVLTAVPLYRHSFMVSQTQDTEVVVMNAPAKRAPMGTTARK